MAKARKNQRRRNAEVNSGAATQPVPVMRSSPKSIRETARMNIQIEVERTKPLAELTPDDIPPGLDPEDVATDAG
jgi:hypothetical protein